MATRPDITAFTTHEERVSAFMVSVAPRRKRRLQAKFPLIGDQPEPELSFCDPAIFELLEASGLPAHRSAARSIPDYAEDGQ